MVRKTADNKFSLYLSTDGTQSSLINKKGDVVLSAGIYYLRLIKTLTDYKVQYSTNNQEWNNAVVFETTIMPYNAPLVIGGSYANITVYQPYQGSIDLKQFSITVDGVPVFSGNKTGIDTIKPDNYTVVGTPTISADGIASGFSTSNYINSSISAITPQKELKVKVKTAYSTASNDAVADKVFWNLTDNTNDWRLTISNGGENIFLSGNNKPSLGFGAGYFNLQDGDIIEAELKVTKTEFSITVSINGATPETRTATYETVFYSISDILIGHNALEGGRYYYTGSIDLNAFKIYVDGNLVYQPCLKIPYTLSHSGSKIADVIYRDRVIDAYQQGFEQKYYTLQENKKGNYTVVGSPTISSDFVASGFSSGNYITKSIASSFDIVNKKYEVRFKSIYNLNSGDTNTTQMYFGMNYKIWCYYDVTNSRLDLYGAKEGGGNVLLCRISSLTLSNNDVLEITASIKQGSQSLKCVVNGTEHSATGSVSNMLTEVNSSINIFIGTNTYGYLTSGSIDLKEFKIYVDNNLAYEAVTDPNFALPMGEIYGDIENCLNVTTATQAEKNAVLGWGVPDYSLATSVSYSSGDAIGFNGYLAITGHWVNHTAFAYLYINNCLIMVQSSANDNGNSQNNHNSIMVEVSSTDVITWTNYTASNLSFSAIPYKGGN